MAILSEFYVASETPDGGVTLFTLTEDGTLEVKSKIPMPSPSWTEVKGGRLCAVLRDRAAGEAYAEYSIPTGRLLFGPVPTEGVSVCHFAKDGDDVYCANYTTGSVLHIRDGAPTLYGHKVPENGELGPDKGRQERPHCHQCLLSPDRRFLLVCDLGLDAVFVYDREMRFVSKGSVPAGHGARHAIFSPDGGKLYVLAEMGSSVTAFDWDGERGFLTFRENLAVCPGHDGLTDAASIVLSKDGEHLYASNRGTANCIAHVTTAGGLRLVSLTPSGGNHPRAISLVGGGRFLVVCNTFSDNLTLFRVEEDGELTRAADYAIPKPLCVNEI
ncbi:MAG: lactonase family protein [Clostridiales bacterium]|nr:lactonase family protein [Clostridiales bacterium]